MLNKLQYRLLLFFFLFTSILICFSILSYLYIQKKDKADNVYQSLKSIHIDILNNMNVIGNFFTYETKNPDFFLTGNSYYLEKYYKNLKLIYNKVNSLRKLKEVQYFSIEDDLMIINNILIEYEDNIRHIVKHILRRGYKDYGKEGIMRQNIHKLENIEGIDLSKVLMLRRHEKDYIIRNEDRYIKALYSLGNDLKDYLQKYYSGKHLKDSALIYLENYTGLFKEVVELDRSIGIKNNTGLHHKIKSNEKFLINSLIKISEETKEQKNRYFKNLTLGYTSVFIFLVFVSIFLSFYLSKIISRNLSYLSYNISEFISSGFSKDKGANFPVKFIHDEVGHLIENYLVLRKEILALIYNFQQMVDKRTKAISCQKDRIEQQKEEIETQRDELYKQKELIEFQKEKVEVQNKDIISGIEYAQFIQEALLPKEYVLKNYFKDYFVLYKPRDILSGDFYWTKRVKNSFYDITLLALADCTGHGVPGALMSMLGIAFLNEIVLKKDIRKPNQVLDKLRDKVIKSLETASQKNITNDGMDIALILLNHSKEKIYFAGANRPLYFFKDGELSIVKGNKMPIGKYGGIHENFTYKQFLFKDIDCLYLFSDGYTDEFGGPENKKFKHHRFRNLLKTHYHLPMKEQARILDNEIVKWRCGNKQTDDILVIGIKP